MHLASQMTYYNPYAYIRSRCCLTHHKPSNKESRMNNLRSGVVQSYLCLHDSLRPSSRAQSRRCCSTSNGSPLELKIAWEHTGAGFRSRR